MGNTPSIKEVIPEYNMRRKAEVLQHKHNSTNITKAQRYAMIARGTYAKKKSWGHEPPEGHSMPNNPNSNNIYRNKNKLVLNQGKSKIIKTSTTSSDVPGREKKLYLDKSHPITIRNNPQRTFNTIGSKFPQWGWEPGANGLPIKK